MKRIVTTIISLALSSGFLLADDASNSSSETESKTAIKPNAPYVELAPRMAPQPFAGVTLVFDSITPPNQFVYPGTIRCYSDAGQGQNIGGQNIGQWWRGGWMGPKLEVDERFLRQRVRGLPPKSMWIVDIEHWPYDLRNKSESEVEDGIRKLRKVLSIVREERPDLCIGSYVSIPTEYWAIYHYRLATDAKAKRDRGEKLTDKEAWALGGIDQFQAEYSAWVKACERMQFGVRDDGSVDRNGGLIDALDVLTPSCYLIYDNDDGPEDPLDIESDRMHLTEMMKQAVRVSGGRPVFPYMMTMLTDPGLPADKRAIRPKRLRAAFEVLRDNGASGVIVWDWTQGRPLDDQQRQAMQIAIEVFGAYVPPK